MAYNLRETFNPGEFVDAVVSYVESPRKFFIQPLSMASELRRLAKRLQVLYGSGLLGETDYSMTLDQLASSLRTGTIVWCAAPFIIQNQPNMEPIPEYYYRAVVLTRTGPSTVKVFYADYGNTSNVPIATLKTLPPSLQELPCMAVPCRLIEGETDAGNIIPPDKLQLVVDGFHVVVFVAPDQQLIFEQKPPQHADPMWVSLFVTDGKEEANVGEMLMGGDLPSPQG